MPTPPQIPRTPAQSKGVPAREPNWTWAWLLAAALIVPLVVFLQQYTLSLESVTLEHAPREKIESEEPQEPGIGPLLVQSKIIVRALSEMRRFNIKLDEEDQAVVGRIVAEIDHDAVSRIDRERAAIVVGDLFGAAFARDRLTRLAAEATPGGDLSREIQWLLRIYERKPAAAGTTDTIPEDARAALIDRHGWFGNLALSFGKPEWDRDRREVIRSSNSIDRVITWINVAEYISYGLGAILLFGVIVLIRNGDLASLYDPEAGGEHRLIYLEVFTLFTGGFLFLLGMRLFAFGMGAEAAPGTLAFLEILSWVLVASVAWPVVRRVPWREFAEGVGLTRGEGVGTEVGYGVMAFLAWMPVLFLLSLLLGLIEKATRGDAEGAAGGFPLFEPPRVNGWTLEWIGVIGAVLWAPFIEEVIVRGCLFRFLRPSLRVWGTVLVTAAVFGMIHPYSPLGMIEVGCMGVLLAFLRQWRGSLVACITVHALHNGLISVLNLLYLSALG